MVTVTKVQLDNTVSFIQVNGSHMTWSHVEALWNKDISGHLYMSKLTYDHIYLSPQSMMKVNLAAQVGTSHRIT